MSETLIFLLNKKESKMGTLGGEVDSINKKNTSNSLHPDIIIMKSVFERIFQFTQNRSGCFKKGHAPKLIPCDNTKISQWSWYYLFWCSKTLQLITCSHLCQLHGFPGIVHCNNIPKYGSATCKSCHCKYLHSLLCYNKKWTNTTQHIFPNWEK